ncbi:integrin alpha-M-like [Sphaeramia orbicularis]|uniref:Integrin alpha-M-like n=1 Tax=Sphaeramia orbicularis TaxID=375764 RepID=A0A673CTQ9_9TELE|nr:integrin alpha-M-like [Sphaeramia orbicularis]
MDAILTATIFLSVLKAGHGFNVETAAWRTLSNSAAGFGAKVIQRRNDLLVSAPLEQYSQSRGKIYKCSTNSCNEIRISGPSFAVNMSLGMSMAMDPNTQNTMVCGPTIPKDCKSITLYKGTCMQIDSNNNVGSPVPSAIGDCPSQADIAFLLDGSGSIRPHQFTSMKQFLLNLVGTFVGKDTRFAIAQFSYKPWFKVHYYFNDFRVTGSWQSQINSITQLKGATFTADGIRRVVDEVFVANRGSRPKVKKVLIVITDGESNDSGDLRSAANSAEAKQIIRFAIGVGDAFNNPSAENELNTIASSPTNDHVFRVDSFDALDQIRKTLQDRIFSIEGSQSGGESLKMEMAQEGFNVAYVPGGFQMTTIGANEWKGGFQQYSNTNPYTYGPTSMESDSYLGYSIAVAKTRRGTFTVVGAPRYQHRGVVMAVYGQNNYRKIDPFPYQFQSGEYFGAEVCAMDVNVDSYSDVILISAPMHVENDREGRVYVCDIFNLNVECRFDSPLVLRGAPDKGRFGSSLAVLPDVNKDGFNDLAVGAPLENGRQGSIYIFHGEGGGKINPTYSQRIMASDVSSGLNYFGMSISPTSFDLSNDNLPDLAVGSKGAVVLLRSQPIVMISTTVSFNPKEISTQNLNCSKPMDGTARVCFTMTTKSGIRTAQANINFTFTLDATRKSPNNRAYISEKQQVEAVSVQLNLNRQQCSDIKFFIEGCPEDSLNPLSNELRYMFKGLPSSSNENLRPSLLQQTPLVAIHQLGFEINCGTDNKCVDNLKVDFNFTRSTEVRVGIDELLNLTVSVENTEENSYNSRVILTYPAELSYRKFTAVQGRIECNSFDSEDGLTRGRTDCTIDKPIFKTNAKALFIVSYGIDTQSQLDRRIFFTTNATSGNKEHSTASEPYKRRWIGVKYSIFMTIESTLSYSNFTYGKNDLEKPVQQKIKVSNDIRALNFTVVIRVPVKLGDKDIWTDSNNLKIEDCVRYREEEPTVTDFIPQIQKNKLVDCSVARCSVFRCTQFMGRLVSKQYAISANLSSGWIEQIGLKSAKFLLTSTASLEYDQNQYIFYSPGSNNNAPVRKIEVEVEVYPEPDFTKEIVGGSLGGLAFLALLTAGLYKAGFFKSKYQEMINNDAAGAAPEADLDAPPAPES